MAGKQIDFPPDQRHSPTVDRALWIIAIVSIILVIVAIVVVPGPA